VIVGLAHEQILLQTVLVVSVCRDPCNYAGYLCTFECLLEKLVMLSLDGVHLGVVLVFLILRIGSARKSSNSRPKTYSKLFGDAVDLGLQFVTLNSVRFFRL
jgi:hypothetical protein